MATEVMLGDVLWENVRLVVPSGHSGLTGIRIDYAGEPIIPWGRPPQWLVLDSFSDTFDADFHVSSKLTVWTYNVDYYPHSFYLYFRISDLPLAASSPSSVIIPVSPK